ncbi:MAG: SDR family NAD(P)-dependent oxidoreductase, partial [Rhodospirillaceae bacterium]
MNESPGAIPQSTFGKKSTADDVTADIDLSGKTALVTGCTSGIGLETMRTLARRGAHVIGTGRTQEKAERARQAVSEADIKGTITSLGCEMEDFGAVAALADTVRATGAPIDILVCNAGIVGGSQLEQVKGIEKQFAVNHLAHFILINRLLAQVKAAEQGRIVIVASGSHHSPVPGGIAFDNLTGEKGYNALKVYGQSKLANVLTARELAKKM